MRKSITLYLSPNNNDATKSGMMMWAVQVAFTREVQSAENIEVLTPEGKRPVWVS